jgi:hypothetical protein
LGVLTAVPNLIGDAGRISIGVARQLKTWEDHRYVFAPGISVLSIEDGVTIEPSRAPLRDLVIAPPGKRTSRIIKIGGAVGGTGGIGGWFSTEDLINPGVRTFYPSGLIQNKDDLETEMQRIANMVLYRGMSCLRFGNVDDRFIVVGLKAMKSSYVEGTDRMMAEVSFDFEAVVPSMLSATSVLDSYAGLTGSQVVTVGGTEPTWPTFYLATSNVPTLVWIGVQYTSLPGSPQKVVAFKSTNAAGANAILTDPRRRGIWSSLPRLQGSESISMRDDNATATMNCQDTVGDGELMPYLLPGTQTVFWSTTAATGLSSLYAIQILRNNAYAF